MNTIELAHSSNSDSPAWPTSSSLVQAQAEKLCSRTVGHRQEASRPGCWARRHPAGLSLGSVLLEELADAQFAGEPKLYIERVSKVPLLIVDDLGMHKLPATAAEDLPEIIIGRYERSSTMLTSNRSVEDWASSSATPPP